MPPRRSLPIVKDEEMPDLGEVGAHESGSIAEEPANQSRDIQEVILIRADLSESL